MTTKVQIPIRIIFLYFPLIKDTMVETIKSTTNNLSTRTDNANTGNEGIKSGFLSVFGYFEHSRCQETRRLKSEISAPIRIETVFWYFQTYWCSQPCSRCKPIYRHRLNCITFSQHYMVEDNKLQGIYQCITVQLNKTKHLPNQQFVCIG